MSETLGPEQAKLLRWIGDQQRRASKYTGARDAAERDAHIDELVSRHLVLAVPDGKSRLLTLTDAGREAAAALPAAKRAASAKKDELRDELRALATRMERLEHKLDRVLERLGDRGASTPAAEPLGPKIVATVRALDTQHRYGGVVPLPALRKELKRLGVGASDGDVDAALIALERDYAVDLLVAQSPATLVDRHLGIERPGRGLAYYVTPRTP